MASKAEQHEVGIPLAEAIDGVFEKSGESNMSKEFEYNKEKAEGLLPAPVSTGPPKPKLSAAMIIPVWMSFSMGVIMYNKYILSAVGFKYPIFLTTWHLLFATIGTRILQATTHLLDGAKEVPMTKDKFVRSILPISFLMSGSLILSNTAYLHLGVAFIQMLKAFVPVAILLIQFTFRLQDPNRRLLGIVLLISSGVAIASYGEGQFKLFGFVVQALAVLFEASRLTMVQVLLHGQQGFKMDPLVSLHYFAPVVVIINAVLIPFTEGLEPFRNVMLVGPWIFLSNALVAFCLNVAAVFLIGVGSGLILTLAGVFKDILMITGSVLLFTETIAPIQVFGYSVALGGLLLFKLSGSK